VEHPTCDNVAKTWYYFERCEALGRLQRVIDRLAILSLPTHEYVRAKLTLGICTQMVTNEIIYYAATHKEEYDQSR